MPKGTESTVFGRVDQDTGYVWGQQNGVFGRWPVSDIGTGGTGGVEVSGTFLGLDDVTPEAYTGQAGKMVKVNAAEDGLEFDDPVLEFTALTDVPSTYVGQAGRVATVNQSEDGLEFMPGGSGSPAAQYMQVGLSGPQTIPTGTVTWTKIAFDTIKYRSGVAWTISSNGILIPTGVTSVCVCMTIPWAANATGYRNIQLYKNGVAGFAYDTFAEAQSATDQTSTVTTILDVVPGDVLDVRVTQNTGGNLNIQTYATLSVFALSSSSVLIGGNSGSLIEEKVLGADASSVTFTGLNSLLDGDYTLEFSYVPSVGAQGLYLYVNGDTTPANYYKQSIYGIGTGTAATNTGNVPSIAYAGTANMPALGAVSIKVVGGKALFMSHYVRQESAAPTMVDEIIGGMKIATITSITSLQIATTTGNILTGSTFRLYGSKTPTQLVSYNPINYAGLSSDRLLRAGEVAYVDFTGAITVPLRIQSEEGIYEITIITDRSYTPAGHDIRLKPNNTTYAGQFTRGDMQVHHAYADSGAHTVEGYHYPMDDFTAWMGGTGMVKYEVSTFKQAKSAFTWASGIDGSNHVAFYCAAFWVNTSTDWTSLGTIHFYRFGAPIGDVTLSGKVIIKRII